MSVAGRLLYRIYYKPRGKRELIRRYGGRKEFEQMLEGEKMMRAYAFSRLAFPGLPIVKDPKCVLNFLTGEKFIHQTLFCLFSFTRFLNEVEKKSFGYRFFDDGSLRHETKSFLAEKFPFIELVPQHSLISLLEERLPANTYPSIRKKLLRYPILNKLVFVHLGQKGINPILDSDMLFLKRPAHFLEWIAQATEGGDEVFYIQDCARNYGYSDQLMQALAPGKLPGRINGGFYVFDSSTLDFDQVEYFIKSLELVEGSNYFLEQALIALIASGYKKQVVADDSDYIVFPSSTQIEEQAGVLQHYVDISKSGYFNTAWKKIIKHTEE